MACERAWWDYIATFNAHVSAIDDLARHATKYIGVSPEDELLLTYEEVEELLELISRAETTLRIQEEFIERYFVAMQQHGRFAVGCGSGEREHDV
jgi:hypothetical protein